jgi:cbb3-type cytochrome oxidase subunit 3
MYAFVVAIMLLILFAMVWMRYRRIKREEKFKEAQDAIKK